MPQTPLSLATAVETARREHPALRIAPERVNAATAGVAQALLRPNPRIFFQTENWRAWSSPGFSPANSADTYLYLSQPVETGGKRAQRTAVAEAQVERARLERELVELQVVTAVKQAYWAASAAARIHAEAVASVSNFSGVLVYHENRVREGAMAEADLIKVRLEYERLQIAANSAELAATRARIELFRAMGQADDAHAALTDLAEAPATPPAADLERALANRPEMKLARQGREAAQAAVRLQRSLARPDVDVVAGYKQTSGSPTVLAGVQWTLPVNNRNQGNISAAEAAVRIAESEIAAQAALVRAEVAAAAAEVSMRRRQVTESLPRLREHASESARIALAAYREGGSDLLRLLDAERVRIEVETLYQRTLGEYRQSIAALEAALGVNP